MAEPLDEFPLPRRELPLLRQQQSQLVCCGKREVKWADHPLIRKSLLNERAAPDQDAACRSAAAIPSCAMKMACSTVRAPPDMSQKR